MFKYSREVDKFYYRGSYITKNGDASTGVQCRTQNLGTSYAQQHLEVSKLKIFRTNYLAVSVWDLESCISIQAPITDVDEGCLMFIF